MDFQRKKLITLQMNSKHPFNISQVFLNERGPLKKAHLRCSQRQIFAQHTEEYALARFGASA
jgi:hypothetical protein